MKQTQKQYICYSCMTKTDNFYINSKTGKRTKFCLQCMNDFSAKERKRNEFKHIFGIIKDIEHEELT